LVQRISVITHIILNHMSKLQIDEFLLEYNLAHSENEKFEFANLIIKNKLYLPNCDIEMQCNYIIEYKDTSDCEILLSFYKYLPVGVCIFTKHSNLVKFFVKEDSRRNGIGRVLYYEIKKSFENLWGSKYCGNDGMMFFNNLDINIE